MKPHKTIAASILVILLTCCGGSGRGAGPTPDNNEQAPAIRPIPSVDQPQVTDGSMVPNDGSTDASTDEATDGGIDSSIPDSSVACSPVWNGDPTTDPTAANSCNTDADCCTGICLAVSHTEASCVIPCQHDSDCPKSLCNDRGSVLPDGGTTQALVCEGSLGGTP